MCCYSAHRFSYTASYSSFRVGPIEERDSSWDSLEFYPDILFHVVDERRMARRNCLLWKTLRLSETMNRWGSMEPGLRHLEPFRRAISINRKSIRCAYTRIHEPVAYTDSLIHGGKRNEEKESKRRNGQEKAYAARKSSRTRRWTILFPVESASWLERWQAGAASNTAL